MSDPLPPPRSPDAKWHGARPDPAFRPKSSQRGRQLFWLTALLLALLGAVLAIVLYPSSMIPPTFLTMTVREYQSPLLPPNAWTVQDGRLLGTHFKAKEEFYDKQNKEQFDKFLARLENWTEGPLVVHLGALGRVYDGEVVLFLGDADPDQPSRGVPFKKILNSMKAKPAGDRLLLLDLGRPIADARLGILADDLPAAVHKELELAALPFFVLTACSPGQLSHVSEELGASVFAYYLDLGLRGFAEQTPDQRVTVSELAEFVKKQVDRWVWVNRGRRQEPRLYGVGKDFPLVQLGGGPLTNPETPKEKAYPAWLKAGWKERDDLYRDGSYRRAPWAFRQLELALGRAEKRWRSGADEDESRIAPEVARTVANFKDAILKARDGNAPRPFSLAEVRDAKSDAFVRDYQVKFERYLNKVFEPGVKIEEGDKARVEEVKKSKAELIEEMKKLPPDAAAAVLVACAVRPPNLTPGRINALVEMLGEIRQNSITERRFAETVYLERLKDLAPTVLENADWQGSVAHQALQTELQAEQVLAELGRTPSGFDPWNKALLTQGETQRVRGDKDLFGSVDFTWRTAKNAYAQAEQAFRAIPLRLDILRAIEEQRDQAFVALPGWQPYLITTDRVDPQEDAAWKTGIAAARGLADLLEAQNLIALDGEPTALLQWKASAGQWQKAIETRIKRLEQIGLDGKAEEYLKWHALLESSRLSADEREKCWTAAHRLGLRLIQTMPAPDASDAEVASLGIVPGDDPTARDEEARKRRRVEGTLEFLDLISYPGLAALDAVEGKEDKPLARKLQEALAQGVPGQFLTYARAKEKLANAYAKADRVSRIFPDELLKRSSAEVSSPFRNPALALHRLNREAFWSFLRDRYQREAKDFRAVPAERRQSSGAEIFYADAADGYGRALP